MKRDSIHFTMTAQLRRDQIRQRLEALAERTDLPAAQLAGRAIAIGLGHIEGDLRLIFPAAAAPTVTSLSTAEPTEPPSTAAALDAALITPQAHNEPASTTATADAPPHAPAQTADTQAAPAPSSMEPPTAPRADVKSEPTPSAHRPGRVSSADAASALNTTMTAFNAHLHRNPKLKRHSKRVGRGSMWDLARLRAEWTK